VDNLSHRRITCTQPIAIILSLALLLFVPPTAWSAGADDADLILQTRTTLDRIEQQLGSAENATREELKSYANELDSIRSSAQECVADTDKELPKLEKERVILLPESANAADAEKSAETPTKEPEPESVSPEIARQLKELQEEKVRLVERRTTCKLILLRVTELQTQTSHYLGDIRNRLLLVREPHLVEVIQTNLDNPGQWVDFTTRLAVKSTGWDAVHPLHLGGAATAGTLGFILGVLVRRKTRTRLARLKVEDNEVSAGLLQAVFACAASYAPVILALAGSGAYFAIIPRADGDLSFPVYLLFSLLAYFIIAAGVRVLLNPCPPASHYLALDESIAQPLSRRSRVLVLIILIWWLLQKLQTDGLIDESMFSLARYGIGLVWVLNVVWVIWLLRRVEGWRDKWAVPGLISLALLTGLVASWIGYMNLGELVIRGITRTLVLFGLAVVLGRFFSDLFDGLDEGRYRWQRAVRQAVGLKGAEYVPGLGWLRVLVKLGLWSGVIMLLLNIWGAEEALGIILRFFRDGFEFAGIAINPAHLLWAILVFAVLLTLSRWMKGQLNSKWLAKTRMEYSAREALVTTFGYVAIAISVIIALSIAGIKFTNLAIIAGALSVGIGFGLQNIVNNFISGLIMLVERPVRTGDWIVVGNTEGHVKRISIRTTSIQTFDRAEVIVPNSDLISGQVTNWTLRGEWGRIRVPVGVAYGSDTAMVRDTLLEIVNNHEDIIKEHPDLPGPNVLFMGFGDSSLNFELRAIVSDINKRMQVTSDINYAIDAAFRERDIEIPFPQRDLNFRGPLLTGHLPKGEDKDPGQGSEPS
jgi:small-conductance mechanosensitive channel